MHDPSLCQNPAASPRIKHHLLRASALLSHRGSSCPSQPQARPSGTSSFLRFAFPSSQSVMVTTLEGLSQFPPSCACSIVCVEILPSSSNSKMNNPVNSPSSFVSPPSHSVILSTCSCAPIPRYSAPTPLPFVLPSVFHLTTSFSLPLSPLVV